MRYIRMVLEIGNVFAGDVNQFDLFYRKKGAEHMKAVAMVKNGNLQTGELGQVDVIDVPMPDVGEEDVLVKVSYASICGSDPHIMRGGFEVPLPLVLGHEMSGLLKKWDHAQRRRGCRSETGLPETL